MPDCSDADWLASPSASRLFAEYSADSPANCLSRSIRALCSATFASISCLLSRMASQLSMMAC